MSSRLQKRIKIVQILYTHEITEDPVEDILLMEEKIDDYVRNTIINISKNNNELEEIIQKNLEKWKLDRLAIVDQVIFKLATYEMIYSEDVPGPVAIDQALNLTKLLSDNGDGKSVSFNNKVLDKINKYLSNE